MKTYVQMQQFSFVNVYDAYDQYVVLAMYSSRAKCFRLLMDEVMVDGW